MLALSHGISSGHARDRRVAAGCLGFAGADNVNMVGIIVSFSVGTRNKENGVHRGGMWRGGRAIHCEWTASIERSYGSYGCFRKDGADVNNDSERGSGANQ